MRLKSALAGLASIVFLTLSAAAQQPAPAPAVYEQAAPVWDPLGQLGVPVIGPMLDRRDELGLSASQVEALERLGTDFVREAIRRQADLMVASVELGSLFGTDPSKAMDLGSAEAKLQELARIQTDLEIALLRIIEAAKAQLTPDQRSKLAALMAGGPEIPADPPGPADPPNPTRVVGHPSPGRPGIPAPPLRHRFEPHRPSVHGRIFIDVGPPLWWEPYRAYPAPPVIVQPPPVYMQPPVPAYWYYCPSARAYYPYVPSCPEPWVLVPATPQ
jgi:hypothetical protein